MVTGSQSVIVSRDAYLVAGSQSVIVSRDALLVTGSQSVIVSRDALLVTGMQLERRCIKGWFGSVHVRPFFNV